MNALGPGFHVYVITATLVALLLLTLAGTTGFFRIRSKVYPNPEDAKQAKATFSERDVEMVQRVQRAHHNLLENAVPFFVVGALFAATGPSRSTALAYCGTFLGARVVHAIVYLLGLQPWRTLAFGVGVAAVLGMAVHVLRAALA